jgi:hypothetical protein
MATARHILMPCIESSFGVAKTSPVLGTDKCYLRLHQEASFQMSEEEQVAPIPYGGGYATEADGVNDLTVCKGRFAFLLFPGVWSSLLLKWAIVPVNTGRTVPWPTTDASGVMPVGDLASLSFYEAFLTQDGSTWDRKRWAGVKCDEWQLAATDTGEGRIWVLSGSCTGIRCVGNPHDGSSNPDATEFPFPADTDYPTGPYTFGHLGSGTGTVKIGTNRNASCAGLTLRGRNRMTPEVYTGRFVQRNQFVGREVTAEATLRYISSPDDRDSYRQQAALDCEFKIDNGTNSVLLDFAAKNVLRPWNVVKRYGAEFRQTLTLVNRYDASAGADLTLTLA